MSLHRRNPRRDWNEAEIINALEAIGVTVCRMSGEGLPDLLCHYRATWLPIEVKGPRGKLTSAQVKLRRTTGFPVVRSISEALQLFGVTP